MSPEAAAAAVQEEVKNRVEQTKRQVDAKMMQGANELRNAALTVLANPSPSAPGSPPGVRSGNLRRNWNMYSSGGGGNGIFGIQSGMHYSGYLEHGTSKMAARPYVEKIKETADTITVLFLPETQNIQNHFAIQAEAIEKGMWTIRYSSDGMETVNVYEESVENESESVAV